MNFIGSYELDVTNGSIAIPWEIPSCPTLTWAMYQAKSSQDYYIVVAPTPESTPEFPALLASGSFLLDKSGNWTLPLLFLEYLNGDTVIVCGMMNGFEMTSTTFNNKEMKDISSLLDL